MEILLRPAVPEDADELAALMRNGVTDVVRRITIIGSPRLSRFVADSIEGGQDDFVVGTYGDRVVGMCAWRHCGDALQLNHLYLSSKIRGQGIGSALVVNGLRKSRRADECKLSVDVFLDNPVARRWYQSWPMRLEQQFAWIEFVLPCATEQEAGTCLIEGWAEAEANHIRHGLSRFTLKTSNASFVIGRLGSRVFRSGNFQILSDPVALQKLRRLDSKRHLLCVGAVRELAGIKLHSMTTVAYSERFVGLCSDATTYLTSALARHSSPVRIVSDAL